jgi:hypothetical protein
MPVYQFQIQLELEHVKFYGFCYSRAILQYSKHLARGTLPTFYRGLLRGVHGGPTPDVTKRLQKATSNKGINVRRECFSFFGFALIFWDGIQSALPI